MNLQDAIKQSESLGLKYVMYKRKDESERDCICYAKLNRTKDLYFLIKEHNNLDFEYINGSNYVRGYFGKHKYI